MKAIIYNAAATAEAALAACTAAVAPPVEGYTGPGPFEEPEPGLPYSYILRHPVQDLWALIADDHVEAVLGQSATTLDESWFPKRNILGMPIP